MILSNDFPRLVQLFAPRQLARIRVGPKPSISAANCVALMATFVIPSTSSGRSKRPRASRFAQRSRPLPSKYSAFIRVRPALQKTTGCLVIESSSSRLRINPGGTRRVFPVPPDSAARRRSSGLPTPEVPRKSVARLGLFDPRRHLPGGPEAKPTVRRVR
jgi:hypothetical protein